MVSTTSFPPLARPIDRAVILADGENLVFRFQEILSSGRTKTEATIYIPGVFVWHPNINMQSFVQAIRANYYTSVAGDDVKIADIEMRIAKVFLERRVGGPTQICPRVFKKGSQSRKTRIVDINITIDALRHSYHHHIDTIVLLSGDGDFLSLIQEVMRQGTQMWVGAFSSGLDERIPKSVDRFFDLDEWFFNKQES